MQVMVVLLMFSWSRFFTVNTAGKICFFLKYMKQQQNHDLDVLFVLCSRSVLAVAVVVCVF